MGDLMHALPALTDASQAFPGIQFDWVVDEAFAEVPSWHPAVNQVIRSAHRRWKRNLWQAIFGGELKAFYRQLNSQPYDVVLDAQNNLKSAVITGLRKGKAHGLNKDSVREVPAQWAYAYQHSIDKSQHSIARLRHLFAQSLGYPLPDIPPDFGIDRSRLTQPKLTLPKPYLVFVHNASWSTKLWPEHHWLELIQLADQAGYHVLLPCGNDEELQRAQRLESSNSAAIALPRLSLSDVGGVLDNAAGAVCCDTGLGHLAGLLDVPAVSFYGSTDYRLIGATGANQHHMIASSKQFHCSPCYNRRCTFEGKDQEMAECMNAFTPDQIWSELSRLIKNRK